MFSIRRRLFFPRVLICIDDNLTTTLCLFILAITSTITPGPVITYGLSSVPINNIIYFILIIDIGFVVG